MVPNSIVAVVNYDAEAIPVLLLYPEPNTLCTGLIKNGEEMIHYLSLAFFIEPIAFQGRRGRKGSSGAQGYSGEKVNDGHLYKQ